MNPMAPPLQVFPTSKALRLQSRALSCSARPLALTPPGSHVGIPLLRISSCVQCDLCVPFAPRDLCLVSHLTLCLPRDTCPLYPKEFYRTLHPVLSILCPLKLRDRPSVRVPLPSKGDLPGPLLPNSLLAKVTRSRTLRDLDRRPVPCGAGPRRRKCPGRWLQVWPSHGSSGQRQRRWPQRRRGLPRRGRAARDAGGVARAERGVMGWVGAGGAARAAAPLLLLLLLLARPPPAAAGDSKKSGEPARAYGAIRGAGRG